MSDIIRSLFSVALGVTVMALCVFGPHVAMGIVQGFYKLGVTRQQRKEEVMNDVLAEGNTPPEPDKRIMR